MDDVRTIIIPTDDTPSTVLNSLFSETPGSLPELVQADGETLAVILADPADTDDDRIYNTRVIPDGTTMILGIGLSDKPPTAGTFKMAYNGNSAGLMALPYNITPAALAVALNGNAARSADGPVTVSQVGQTFTITDTNPGVRANYTADGSMLTPLSAATIQPYRAGTAGGQTNVVILNISQACYATQTAYAALPVAGYALTQEQPGDGATPSIQDVALTTAPYGGTFSVDGKIIPWNASAAQFAVNYFGNTSSAGLVAKIGPYAWRFTQAANGAKVSAVSIASLLVPTGFLININLSTFEFLFAFAQTSGDFLTPKIVFRVTFPGALPKTFLLTGIDIYRTILNTPNIIAAAIPGISLDAIQAVSAAYLNGTLTGYVSSITSAAGGGGATDLSGLDDTNISTYSRVQIREYVTSPGVGLTSWVLEADADPLQGARTLPSKTHDAATNPRSWRQRG